MDKKLIKEALIHHPHVKTVWVCDNGYTTIKRSGAVEVNVEDLISELHTEEETTLQEIPVKRKKK